MLPISSNATLLVFWLFTGSWTILSVLILLIAGVGALVFVKFRGRGSVVEKSTDRSHPHDLRGIRDEVPVRSVRSEASRLNADQFARHLQESLEINDLPIGQITGLSNPQPIEALPSSDDDGLLAAIDEVQDDSEADLEFRAVALRVLAGFKTQNSIEALTQIALYDLSSTLRAKAVATLADFDHQSVFETIVVACADPSREVRAAGAKALVKVTFDRGDEWARFAHAEDKYLTRQIARAAIEAGLAERSFDRLTLRDEKSAYEGFALVYLLVKAGETEKIFEAIANHRDIKIRVALLHILKVANVAEVIPPLSAFIAGEPMSSVVGDKAREVLLGIDALPVEA
ncbi:MAG: HEAT repeat domain-containing protein [bacterium]|nr:HEAT repeat domain-containing protein [bacterium]